MAPLWKAMLSKSSPLYRDSLFSFTLWEWKVQERELILLKKHSDRERRTLRTQLDKLSKELQQKDKLIESLRAKLNQNHHHPQRSDTPCSSHALSDQSDRISYVSDEQGSTNEDLELCSDVDANSDPGPEETGTRGGTGHLSVSGSMSHHPSVPPSIASCLSCPIMQCSTPPHHPDLHSHSLTGFPVSQSKPPPVFPLSHPPSDSSFLPLSYPSLRSSPFGAGGLDPILTMKTGTNLLESSALWDTAYTNRSIRVGADLSSGSSGYQSGPSHTGSDLMKEHLREIRTLRQRLEDSIQTNDRLRQQLEDQLARTAANKGAPTNIYIQGLDSMGQLSNEIRILKEENIRLQNQIQQAAKEGSKEAERLQEAALLDRARLKEAELEAEKWAEHSRKAAVEADALSQEVVRLKQERQRNMDAINRLQHELNVLQQQLNQSRSLGPNLQRHVQGHHGIPDSAQSSDDAMTFDPRELQVQLERQLKRQTGGDEPRARRQLFNVRSPPVRDIGLTGPEEVESMLQGDAPDGCFSNRRGRHAVGHVDHFKALQQQILEGGALLRNMEATVQTLAPPTPDQSSDSVVKLRSDSQTLRQILQEAESLLRMFWRAALPNVEDTRQNRTLEDEVVSLRLRLLDSEQALKDAMEKVKNSNRTKDSMEAFIVSQLSRTRDVLKTAKTNLQAKTPDCSVSSSSLLVGVS